MNNRVQFEKNLKCIMEYHARQNKALAVVRRNTNIKVNYDAVLSPSFVKFVETPPPSGILR